MVVVLAIDISGNGDYNNHPDQCVYTPIDIENVNSDSSSGGSGGSGSGSGSGGSSSGSSSGTWWRNW